MERFPLSRSMVGIPIPYQMLEIKAIRFALINLVSVFTILVLCFLPTTQQWYHISRSKEEHIIPTYEERYGISSSGD